MKHVKGSIALAAIAACMVIVPIYASAAEAPATSTDEMDAQIKALEKRVDELEAELQSRGARVGQWRENFDQMFDRLQREMEGNGPGMRLGPRGFATAQKPRLGVELDKVNTDLKDRFKNDVKEGAFVMSVVPNSPAEKAGLLVGDAITKFNDKGIADPQDLIDAVHAAPKGNNNLTVSRHGKEMLLKVDLGGTIEEPLTRGGWLERGKPSGGENVESRTEIKASSLELTDALAKRLKLTDDQRKKMGDILAKHAKELSDDVASLSTPHRLRRGGLSVTMNEDVSGMAEKHTDAAAKELAGVLNPDQLKDWNAYRKTHSSLSVSQFTEIQGGGGMAAPENEKDF